MSASRVSRGLVWLLALAGAGVCALAVAVVARTAPPEQAAARAVVELAVVGVPIGAGLYAIWAPRNPRFGALLVAAGFLWSLTALGEASGSVAYSIGRVAGWMVYPCTFYLILSFPEGRVADGLDRRVFRALNLLVAALFIGSALFVEAYPAHTPWATCTDDCPANAFLLLDHEPVIMGSVVQPLRELLAAGLLVGLTVSMALRRRTATPVWQRTMSALLPTSAASAALLTAFLATRRFAPDAPAVDTLAILWSLSVPAIALAFVVGLMQRRLLVAHVLTRLAPTLSDRPASPRLREELAAALGDPTLEVLLPQGPARWRDSRGRLTEGLPDPGDARRVTVIRDGGAPAVALVHDAGLQAGDELVEAVGSIVVAALRQQRLAGRLASSLAQLESSRRRMVRAADLERARIERDLHDGAQQRLVNLRIRLSLAEDLLRDDPAAGALALGELGTEVDRTLEELRALAHGVYPSLLSDRGLTDALRSLAMEAPLPVHLHASGVTRQSTEIESAVYFTCAEAMQNVIKHAGATGIWITLRQTTAHIAMEVRDDGRGFTPPPAADADARGLRNMRDRLEAVGGSLILEASPGHGTRVIGRVPLG